MKILVLFIFFFFLLSTVCTAQKVGLVLSGGGAKGLAHIGVIKALEENHIPIDYITGTSMGAIIGALYSSGYSVHEMESLFKSEEFKLWAWGIVPPKYKYYFKKMEENPAFYDLDFVKSEDKLRLRIPTNLISPGQMDFAFMQLFGPANAHCGGDFNKLYVPFRCVATDIYRNRPVVLSKGDLGLSVRASMTIPFFFKPIEIDSILLFDGGLINNFPLDVMVKDFNPDIVIGSAVDFEDKKPKKEDLLLQIENMITRKSVYDVPDSIGITIRSQVDHIPLLDFDRFDEAEKKGYETAMEMMDRIKSRISERTDTAALSRRRDEYRRKSPPLLFDGIDVRGLDEFQKRYIVQSIFHKDKVIDIDDLKKEYFKILADDKIKSLQPYATYNSETGHYCLNLLAEPQRSLSVGLGGYFSLSDVNEAFLGFNYRLFNNQPVTVQSNIHFGRFYTSFLLGSRFEFLTRNPYSLDFIFTRSRLNYFSGSSELFFGDKSSYFMRNENNMRLNLSFPAKTTSKWELGVNYFRQEDGYFQNSSYTRSDIPDHTVFSAANLHFKFEQMELNKKQYPTEGNMLSLETTFIFGKETETPGSTSPEQAVFEKNHRYLAVHLKRERYFNVLNTIGLGYEIDSWISTKQHFHNYTSTVISANTYSPTVNSSIRFLPFLRSDNYAAGGLKVVVPLSTSTHIRLEGYYFQPVKQILADVNNIPYYDSRSFSSNLIFGCGGLVVHTPVGPATLLLNAYNQGDPRFFLQASFGYLLTNKRGN